VFDALAGVVATLIFCGVKIFAPNPNPDAPPQPAPLLPIPYRGPVERLPEGTIRSQYGQHNIWMHRYGDVNNLDLQEPDLRAALAQPMPIHRYHDLTCCAMAATLVDYFYRHGFADLTPIKLDALLAKAVHVDHAIRQANLRLGLREIEIFDLTDGLQLGAAEGLLPAFQIDLNHVPIQKNLTPNNLQDNTVLFQELLTGFLAPRAGEGGPLAGSLLLNSHFNGDPTGHFTGLCIDRDERGQILQIYVSESSSSFSGGVQYTSGDNRWGAMVVPIGNTIDAAAAQLARFFSREEMATLFQTVVPV
jgi:hypothetical protein